MSSTSRKRARSTDDTPCGLHDLCPGAMCHSMVVLIEGLERDERFNGVFLHASDHTTPSGLRLKMRGGLAERACTILQPGDIVYLTHLKGERWGTTGEMTGAATDNTACRVLWRADTFILSDSDLVYDPLPGRSLADIATTHHAEAVATWAKTAKPHLCTRATSTPTAARQQRLPRLSDLEALSRAHRAGAPLLVRVHTHILSVTDETPRGEGRPAARRASALLNDGPLDADRARVALRGDAAAAALRAAARPFFGRAAFELTHLEARCAAEQRSGGGAAWLASTSRTALVRLDDASSEAAELAARLAATTLPGRIEPQPTPPAPSASLRQFSSLTELLAARHVGRARLRAAVAGVALAPEAEGFEVSALVTAGASGAAEYVPWIVYLRDDNPCSAAAQLTAAVDSSEVTARLCCNVPAALALCVPSVVAGTLRALAAGRDHAVVELRSWEELDENGVPLAGGLRHSVTAMTLVPPDVVSSGV